MKIKQVILADPATAAGSVLESLKQLGLQISDRLGQGSCSDSLLICPPGYEEDTKGSLLIRQALAGGAAISIKDSDACPVLEEIAETGGLSQATRDRLKAYALFRCLQSDARRLEALQAGMEGMPLYAAAAYEKMQELRYGENWHQKAALYVKPGTLGLQMAKKLNGKEMSYNNMVDAETVLEMLIDLSEYDGVPVKEPLSVIVKHANPCGVAYAPSLAQAYKLSFATDPKSAFGGVIGFNRPVDADTARAIGESFVEVLLAPGYDPEALRMLTEKKPNRRILDIGDLLSRQDELYRGFYQKNIFGGMMLQDYDRGDIKEWRVVTERPPTESEAKALRFAWKVSKYVKSNALVYTTDC
ncbi:MAG TPA: phosphoribosylaminoimidazolecarboxamide formyltransferase, partial [Methanothrix sp.]|nr:phosphoribosylaminoimidazolecarboxamide formyltransferase [Methanothrix sp.]